MTARLFAKTGQLAGASYTIGDEATIGKSPENTIQLYPGLISGHHARIYFDTKAGSYFIEDLKSRNGTRVDGIAVAGKEKLDRLHVISFANQFDFVFQVVENIELSHSSSPKIQKFEQVSPEGAKQSRKPEPAGPRTIVDAGFDEMPKLQGDRSDRVDKDAKKTVVGEEFLPIPNIQQKDQEGAPSQVQRETPQERDSKKTVIGDSFVASPRIEQPSAPTSPQRVTPDAKKVGPGFYLEVLNLPSGVKSFDLQEGENLLGREAGCAILIDDGSLSRKHAVLILREGKVYVKDLGSKNNTLLERQRINYETEIHAGANLTFGMINAVLRKR